MSLIEKGKGVLYWNHLKLDEGLTKRESLSCRETQTRWTSAGSQSRLGAQGRYFKAMAKFSRLMDEDSNSKDRNVANSCSRRDCSAKFSYSSLPIAASLMPCYLSPCAALGRAMWDMPTNGTAALQQGRRVHAAKEIRLGFSPSVCRIVPHSKSATSAAINDKPTRVTVASAKCGSLKSFSVLTGGVSKSSSVSPCYASRPHCSTTSSKKKLLSGFPESGNMSPVKWTQVLYTPATLPETSTLPTLTLTPSLDNQKPSDSKSLPRCNTSTSKLCDQRGENNSSVLVLTPPAQEHRAYSLSLSRVQLPCVFRPACLESDLASKIMFSDRQVDCSYINFPTPSSHRIKNPTERSASAVLKGTQNKASEKLPGVSGSEDNKEALASERTSGDNANAKTCKQQQKLALPSKVNSDAPGHVSAKHQHRRPGWQRRFTGSLKDKKCPRKGNDSVCLPQISNKTTLGNGAQFANRNNAALAYVPHASPRAAKNCASARSDVATHKNAGNTTKNYKSTKEKLPGGCAKSRDSFVKTEEKNGHSPTKPNIADNLIENDAKQCRPILTQGVNITTGKNVTKLPGLKLSKKVGKSRPRSKRRNGQHTVLCDARKPIDAGGQPRHLRKPQGTVLQEVKSAAVRLSKRFPCSRPRQGAKGVGNTKHVLQLETIKPSASNSVASVITEEEEALLRAKWAELKFLNLPPPKKPKDEPPRNKPNDLKDKKTNRATRNGSVRKKSGKKSRRKNVIQKKKAKNI